MGAAADIARFLLPTTVAVGGSFGKDVYDTIYNGKWSKFDGSTLAADLGQDFLDTASGMLAGYGWGTKKTKQGLALAAALELLNHGIGVARSASGGRSNAIGADLAENYFVKPENKQKSLEDLKKEANETDKKAPEQPVAKSTNNTTPNSTNTNQTATNTTKAPTPKAPTENTASKAPAKKVSNTTGELYTPKSTTTSREATNGKHARTYWKEAGEEEIEGMRNTADFKRSLQDYANTNLSQGEKERRAAADIIELNRRKLRSQRV